MSEPVLMPFQDQPFNGDSFVCKEFLKLKKELGLTVAVETGSCLYSTTKWLAENFDKVYTVELNEEYARHGKHKIENLENVIAVIGDSVDFLNKLKLSHEDRAIYFLDAHWGQHCPLLEELSALKYAPTKLPPVIAIHDWYTGNEKLGWDEYNGQRFEYSWIEPIIKTLEQVHACTYEHYFNTEAENGMRGLIYLVPKVSWAHQIRYNGMKVHSQSGEEGYINYILSKLHEDKPASRHLVEIGAWDGYHLSNTRFLIDKGYSHLLIDGDNHGNEEVKEHFVTKDNIVEILEKYDTPEEFDLLCIDIDGNDLYVIESILGKYKPSLIVAEFNPIFQPHESKTIAYDEKHTWGNDDYYGFSFLAGLKMAEKYGYVCVHQNDNLNMYFVRKDMIDVVPPVSYTPTNYHPKSEKNNWVDY